LADVAALVVTHVALTGLLLLLHEYPPSGPGGRAPRVLGCRLSGGAPNARAFDVPRSNGALPPSNRPSLGETCGERAHSLLDPITDRAEGGKPFFLGAARERGIGKVPAKLHAGARGDRTVRVADRNDDIPALADVVHRLAPLHGDVDSRLTHRAHREAMEFGRLRARALPREPAGPVPRQRTLGHLRPRGA